MKTWKKFKEDNNLNIIESETLSWGSMDTSERKELLKDIRLPSSFAKNSWKDLDFRVKEKLGKHINKTTMGEFRLDERLAYSFEPDARIKKGIESGKFPMVASKLSILGGDSVFGVFQFTGKAAGGGPEPGEKSGSGFVDGYVMAIT